MLKLFLFHLILFFPLPSFFFFQHGCQDISAISQLNCENMPLTTQSILTCEKDEIIFANLIFLYENDGIYNRNVHKDVISVKINRCENPGKFCGVHQ